MVLLFCITTLTNVQAQSADTTITVKVTGVTCSNDLATIKANVEKVEGVSACKAVKQGATSSFEINYNAQLSTKEEIDAAIEGTAGCKDPKDRPYKVKRKKVKQKT
jgi:copper chaperone CopZ